MYESVTAYARGWSKTMAAALRYAELLTINWGQPEPPLVEVVQVAAFQAPAPQPPPGMPDPPCLTVHVERAARFGEPCTTPEEV